METSKYHPLQWNDKFELSDESYSIWDIQNYFKRIIKKHER